MKIKIALMSLFVMMVSLSIAQPKYILDAEEVYQSQNYSDATKVCSDAYKKVNRKNKRRKGDMAYMTAQSYRFTERYRDANEWYDRTILLDYAEVVPEVYLYNAEMLMMMGEFDKASDNYKEYLKLVPNSQQAKAGVESCERHKDYVAEKTKHIIENQSAINVKEFDMAPMIGDRKGVKIYYSSSREGSTGKEKDPRTGEIHMDLWVTELDKKGNWTSPYLVNGEGINTEHNEGTVCFDSRYKTMFFTRCPSLKKQNLGCEIFMSEAKGKDEWKEPTLIKGLKNHDSISVGHPCTADGKFLIFASDLAGGMGGKDLWSTTYDKKSDTWSTPVNLGPEINTPGDELFPTFAINGDLFYASNGMPGMGGLDIFRAAKVGEDNKWENPKNLGAPINSVNNDYALIEVEEKYGKMQKGYFTSERKTSTGVEYNPDIYMYELPPNLFDLKVVVSEVEDKNVKIEDVKVSVTSSTGDKWEGYTDENGAVFWDKKPSGDRYIQEEVSYKINISKEGYHEDSKGSSISTEGLGYSQNFVVDMSLLPKKPIRLPEVRYPLNKWDLLVDSTINSPDSLLFVYTMLEEHPGLVLELSSHTDSRGSNSANQKLSENRAKACYKYLVEQKGVDPRRIVPVGKGENNPRTVWKSGDTYMAAKPKNMDGVEEIVLTEAYINKFRKDKKTFDMLHGLNRRTEGAVITLDFDPETAPEADPKLLEYVKYP